MRSNNLRAAMTMMAAAATTGLAAAVQGVSETARSAAHAMAELGQAHDLSELGQGLPSHEMQALVGQGYRGYHTGRYAKRVGGKKNPAGTKLARRAEEHTVGRARLK